MFEALLIASAFGSIAAPRVPVATDSAITVLAAAEPAPADTGLLRFIRIPIDTPPPRTRPRAIQVSDWYSRRLTIHRYVAYSTIPVFAAQWIAGNQLLQESRAAPEWSKFTHRAGATALAETSNSARHLHHQVALISMGVTVVSGTAMKIWNK